MRLGGPTGRMVRGAGVEENGAADVGRPLGCFPLHRRFERKRRKFSKKSDHHALSS